jgi:hypothetical protein
MRLKIELFTNWWQEDNPEGPVTFRRQQSTCAFQVSWAEYRGKKPLPEPTTDKMRRMALEFGQKSYGSAIESYGGSCRFGTFGTAVFRTSEHPRIQIWITTNGHDHILATHICDREPGADEISEVQQIASSLALGPEIPAS